MIISFLDGIECHRPLRVNNSDVLTKLILYEDIFWYSQLRYVAFLKQRNCNSKCREVFVLLRSVMLFLLVVYTAIAPSPALAAGAALDLGAVAGITPGQTVTVTATLSGSAGNISAVGMDIAYDPAKLSNPVGSPASGAVNWALSGNVVSPGLYRIGLTRSQVNPATGLPYSIPDGQVFSVTFTVSATAIGTITLGNTPSASDITAAANPVTITGANGNIALTVTTTAPGAPAIGAATAGNAQATVSFTAPAASGGSPITSYTVTSSPGGKTGAGTAGPIIVTGLTNGTAYTFTVTAANAMGSSVASSASNSVTPNVLIPIIGAPSSTIVKSGASVTYTVTYPGADTITLATGNITINRTGTANGTAAVSGSGATARTVTIANLSGEGTLGISISAGTGAAGSIAAAASSASAVFSVDNTAPVLVVTALADNTTTSSNTLNISGTASDINGIQAVTVNGGSPVTLANGAFNTAVALNSGANTITVVATDMAGNQKADTRIINFDWSALIITLTSPTPADQSFTNQQTAVIAGTLNKPGTVVITLGAMTPVTVTTNGTNNSFSTATPLTFAPGLNTIGIKASDTAAPPNNATVQRRVTYDTIAPALAITDPADAITTTSGSYPVKGTVTDNFNGVTLSFAVDGVAVTPVPAVGTDGVFNQNVNLNSAKTYHIVVTATDQAGNVATVQRNIIFRPLTISDALRALRISVGIETFDTAKGDDKLDVAPLVNGKPQPDGLVDAADAVVLLRRVAGIVSW